MTTTTTTEYTDKPTYNIRGGPAYHHHAGERAPSFVRRWTDGKKEVLCELCS